MRFTKEIFVYKIIAVGHGRIIINRNRRDYFPYVIGCSAGPAVRMFSAIRHRRGRGRTSCSVYTSRPPPY